MNHQAAFAAVHAIGDIQGCDGALAELLGRLPVDARLWFAGDLVNRGPESLAALRRIRALPGAVTVLGNHDLHLLATTVGARKISRGDTLDPILTSPERAAIVDWLRSRPIAHAAHGHLLVHAGVDPAWDLDTTLALADEVETVLRGPYWGDFMHAMSGDGPERWSDALSGDERLRAIVNVLTRLRFVHADGRYAMKPKGGLERTPAGMRAWFDMPGRRILGQACVVFGHWSTLGLLLRDDVIALDTGCVWGGSLSAVRLADRRVTQVDCPGHASPGD
ncbi:MAG: symmetrical bis(5'-nucleosyl)-tetraphosphatase [Burkholderiaceae bacterium]